MSTANATINSATPAADLRTAIETLMTAHSNWTFIETVTIATTSTYNVWKNHGTGVTDNNSFGSDFYISLMVNTATPTTLNIKAFEAWDATGKLAIRPCPTGGQATNADASALATGGVVLSTATMANCVVTCVSTPNTNEYYIALSKNALKVMLRRSSDTTVFAVYAGLFNSWVTDTNEFPLCLGGPSTSSTNFTTGLFATSRNPKRVSAAALTASFMYNMSAANARSGDTGQQDLFFGKIPAATPLLISAGGTTTASTLGRLRGVLYDTVIIDPASGVTLGMGDNIPVDGDTYWYFGSLSALSIWTNQAAV